MKTNKILSLIAALALTAGTSMTAVLAMEGDCDDVEAPTSETYTDVSSVTISKTYNATNTGTTSPAETFYLVQDGDGTVSERDVATGEVAPALCTDGIISGTEQNYVASVEYEAGDAGKSGSMTKEFSIDLPEYTKVGVYTYTLKEVEGSNAGVTYRTSAITLKVTVIEQDGLVRVAGVHTETAGGDKSDSFSDNEYSAGTLKVTKTVEGLFGDKTKYFPFTVKLSGVTGKTYANSYTITTTSTYDDNDATIKVGDEDGATVYLKDGDSLSIANLPYGVTYTVTEADNEGYNVKNVVTDSDDENGRIGTIDSALETDAYTNTKGGTVDTGIFTDSTPYIAMVGIVAVIAVAFIARKRRVKE